MKASEKKIALVVGNTGQDGVYLTELLKGKNYFVIGVNRKGVTCNDKNLPPVDIGVYEQVQNLVKEYHPHEIYYLAAIHHSSEEQQEETYKNFSDSMSVHVMGLVNFLEAINTFLPNAKLFYAASSHIFGRPEKFPQTETTAFQPICVYGITKATGVEICKLYRQQKGVFCSVGILYNHESPLRCHHFLSKKIVSSAVRIKLGLQNELVLGNLSAQVDWSHAKDVVIAMNHILQLNSPDDFIIATGKLQTVENFAVQAFNLLGLEISKHLKQDSTLLKKHTHKVPLCGDISKISNLTGWEPLYSFENMVEEMVLEEVKRQTYGNQ